MGRKRKKSDEELFQEMLIDVTLWHKWYLRLLEGLRDEETYR